MSEELLYEERERKLAANDLMESAQMRYAREFLLALVQVIQISRFHQLNNEALREPLDLICSLSMKVCGDKKTLSLAIEEGQIFVNSRRMKFTSGAFRSMMAFVQMLKIREIGGFEFLAPLPRENLCHFLEAFHEVAADKSDALPKLERMLHNHDVAEIGLIKPGETETPLEVELETKKMAALLYSKAVVIAREVRNSDNHERLRYLGTKATRVIQELISVAERDTRPLHWLVQVPNNQEYIYTHSTKVALISLLIGLEIGIERNAVCSLGTAALYYDMGHLELPDEVSDDDEEQEKPEASEWQLRNHAKHGIKQLLNVRMLNVTVPDLLVVVFEHARGSEQYAREDCTGMHLFSRIVAIADAYDAATHGRYGKPMPPDKALEWLMEDRARYDPDLVRVFINVMGIYPVGTVALLSTGELGLVCEVDPATPRRPYVRIIEKADGTRIDDGELVDLGQRDESGALRASIIDTLDSVEAGVYVPGYYFTGDL